ncbi:hypothetical protein FH968_04440 [Buttiauxella sp. B2]|uniref:hypothetical protein n=1 Tax=Buttiauxella sp. B2 TaxID=2587812 RepID=UPI00112227A5|nr:hypothetical protein [Buttiauxella sp. B2]TNV22129.1 hypothetical protein FH968_04440 [Buttiauxella sp. B2]
MNQLNTPVKRIGFLVLAIGLALFAIGWIMWAADDFVYGWEEFIRSVTFDTYLWNNYNNFMCYGFYLALFGAVFSYFYDLGIGQIVRWIKGS